jgi:4-amino-4-deoxy-L-arabinose transferase-like glycosyltransferase
VPSITQSRSQTFRDYALVAGLILVAIIIHLPLLFTPLTSGFSDNWRQADTASIARNFLNGGFNLFYPQINWGGNGPGYVEAEFQLYPFIVALLYKVFGEYVWLGRLVSLLFAIGTLVVFYWLARMTIGLPGAAWALFAFVFSPLIVRYSTAFMPEAAVLFFYVLALTLFQVWLNDQKNRTLWLAGVSTALAILVKPTSIHVGLIFLFLLVEKSGLRFLRRGSVWLFAAICLVPGVLWYLHARNLYLIYGNTFGVISGGDSKFGNLSYWLSPSFYLSLVRLDVEWVFTVGGALLFVVGLIVYVKRRASSLILFGIPVILAYYMIVARYAQEAWGIQYHIFLVPYAAIAIGTGLNWLFDLFRQPHGDLARRVLPWAGSIALLLMLLASGNVVRTLLQSGDQTLYRCGLEVAKVVPREARIVVSTTSREIEEDGTVNNFQEPDVFFYSDRFGWSLPADKHNPELVRKFQQDGARYLIITDTALLDDNQALADYLKTNARQIGPGPEKKCGIYELVSPN